MSNVIRYVILFGMICTFVLPVQLRAEWPVNGLPVCLDAGNQQYPQIVPDGAGGAFITWRDCSNEAVHEIYICRINEYGTKLWTTDGITVNNDFIVQNEPQIISDDAGGIILTWDAAIDHHIYAQRFDANGDPLWDSGGVAICTAEEPFAVGQFRPCMARDESGGAVIAWEDFRYAGAARVFVQRVDADGSTLWPADGVRACPDNDSQKEIGITSDGAGGAIVTWSDIRSGLPWPYGPNDIYAQRIDSSAALVWGSGGTPVSTVAYEERYSHICSDGTGGAFFAWLDLRDLAPMYTAYAHRLDASGAALWTVDGVAFAPTLYMDNANQIVIRDGAGGAIITCEEWCCVGDSDIYAQRFDSSGAQLWTSDAVSVCSASGDKRNPRPASDGAGGVIIAWDDDRSGNKDIYAQHLDENGAKRWTSSGIPICTAPYDQYYPQIITDGVCYAIVTWQDYRTGTSWDIYAQHLFFGTGGETPEAPAESFLAQNVPNPFNPTTTIRFDLPRAVHVKLCVYNVKGELISTIVNRYMTAGRKEVSWTAKDNRGRGLASGNYFYRIVAGDFVETKKMVLLK